MYSDNKGISSDNYVVIQGWMCNELNLKGNDLLVFALIYGFCQDGKSMYSGGRQYIADTFNISVRTVITTLQSLVEQGLIVRHESNDFVHPDIYTVAGTKETLVGGEKISLGVVKKLHGGSEKFSPNNTSNKLIDNNDNKLSLAKPTVIAEHSDKPKRTPLIPSSASKSEKKPNLYVACTVLINNYAGNNERLRKKLMEFLDMRIELIRLKNKPFSDKTFKGYLNRLSEITTDTDEQLKIIQHSIDGQYPAFYAPDRKYSGYNNRNKFAEGGKGLKTVQADMKEDLNEVL